MKKVKYIAVTVLAASFLFLGCEKPQEVIPEAAAPSETNPHITGEIPLEPQTVKKPAGPMEVIVPDDVKASWKAVRVEVTNNETEKKEIISVEIGQELLVPGSTLKLKILTFLPSFQMDGPKITSKSNEEENPAAQMEIVEGETFWTGWLFSLYPTTHAFTHPKYSVTLLGGIASEEAPEEKADTKSTDSK